MPRNIRDAFRIEKLISLYLKQELSRAEQAELEQWVHERPANEQLFSELTNDSMQAMELEKLEQFEDDTKEEILHRILQAGRKKKPSRRLWQYAAAASIGLLIIAAITIMAVNRSRHPMPEHQMLVNNDVPPGGNKAILTLANGKQIVLDSNANGLLAQQGNMQVINLAAGQLAYHAGKSGIPADEAIAFNTLTTPKGGQYQVILPDGSKVWLNAASSLRYPARFGGNERRVTLTGEAYFEVVHNDAVPFIVDAGKAEIKDIGTEFNVNAYADAPAGMTATVVKGAVSVAGDKNKVVLAAGEQAKIKSGNNIRVVKATDIKQVIAWKNGLFWFNQDSITEVMDQIARWYNVDVVYQGDISAHFSGSIHRDVNVSVVFKVLEETGGVHFRIEGRKITVMP